MKKIILSLVISLSFVLEVNAQIQMTVDGRVKKYRADSLNSLLYETEQLKYDTTQLTTFAKEQGNLRCETNDFKTFYVIESAADTTVFDVPDGKMFLYVPDTTTTEKEIKTLEKKAGGNKIFELIDENIPSYGRYVKMGLLQSIRFRRIKSAMGTRKIYSKSGSVIFNNPHPILWSSLNWPGATELVPPVSKCSKITNVQGIFRKGQFRLEMKIHTKDGRYEKYMLRKILGLYGIRGLPKYLRILNNLKS